MSKLSPIKSKNSLTHMKSINHLSLVMRKRVLRRPIVFLRVRCSICVRCNILIFLLKMFVEAFVRCSIPHCIPYFW